MADDFVAHEFDPVRYALEPEYVSNRAIDGYRPPKDLAALRQAYEKVTQDQAGVALLRSVEQKNKQLLRDSHKDIDILDEIYG